MKKILAFLLTVALVAVVAIPQAVVSFAADFNYGEALQKE